MNLASLFGFPSTLDLDSIEVLEQTMIVHLHATTPSAACPQGGTAGSRVHSRYSRTIADVAFGGRNLELQLLVRKWICPEASCSRHIFAERFPELVQRYGTILVDLEKRRVVQLLAERSVETSKAWLRKHPEIDLVSRDRGKLFREATTDGAPQAKQVVDRFHLQKNFAAALENFFRKQERVLKKARRGSTGKAHPVARTTVPEKIAHERRARHRQHVRVHKRIWKLYREGYHKEQIAQLVGVSSRSVYRALAQQAPPPPRRRSRSSSIVDPYLSAPFFAMEPGVP